MLNTTLRKTALTTAGLALTAGAIAGPLTTLTTPAHAAPTTTITTDRDNHDRDRGDHRNRGDRGGGKELRVNYAPQPNFYYCGPAAARHALTAGGHDIPIDELATQMGTTEAGTNSAEDITKALNKATNTDKYRTTELSNPHITDEQITTLKHDLTTTIDDNRALVANVVGTATDTNGTPHTYEGGHYITVHAYTDNGDTVKIADSANPNTASYWITTTDLAHWMATRGYTH
ncbi:C39 family peptidase [Plantactinospora sp. GCM10030261]|uniref:C39 family peptidase n=1 Tax=Plantactinospora sp. GCM10030261 TaxID=3273420 RepID=UPI0036073744